MWAAPSSPVEIAFALHAVIHGRFLLWIALYGQAFAHWPQLTHKLLSILALKSSPKEIAFLGQAILHLWAKQPLQSSVTLYPSIGHSSQAILITEITFSPFLTPLVANASLSETIALSL